MAAAPFLRDSFGRVITDLRISVTDRCNYRCVYCRVGRGEEEGAPAADRGGRAALPPGKIGAKGCEFPQGGPLPGDESGAAPAKRSADLGPRGPQVGASMPPRAVPAGRPTSGTRAAGALGPAPTEDALSWAALQRLARVFVGLGIRKVRLTGGEPLLRRGLADYIGFLRGLGVGDIALTTNGHLFAGMAEELRRAGLGRVTISLDSLQPEKFARITRVPDGLPRVLAALDAAGAAGLAPVKVNVVLLRGFNDDEVEALAEFARGRAATVRFIEFMPLEQGHLWTPAMVVPMREIVERIQRVYPLAPLPRRPGETACRFRFADGGPGEIGIVAPVTSPFCNQCSRVRLTADGKLRTCLFSLQEWDLRPALEAGDEALAERILRAVALKEERHHIGEAAFVKPARGMVQIGG